MLDFAIAGAAIVGAGLTAAYQSVGPRARWYGRTFAGLSQGTKQIALTFDDGPNDPCSFELLDVLARHQVHATFFMIGQYVRRRPDIVREVANAGHAIGNHTFSHPLLTFQSQAGIGKELSDCRAALRDAVGEHSDLFRPPFGGRRPAVLRVTRELGLQPVMWSVTGYDWDAPSAAVIERKVTSRVRGGDVILLHDGGHKRMGIDRSLTIQATDRLLTRYRDEGYAFVTIPEMMTATGCQPGLSAQ